MGRTHVKDELVHGSYRVSSDLLAAILSLDISAVLSQPLAGGSKGSNGSNKANGSVRHSGFTNFTTSAGASTQKGAKADTVDGSAVGGVTCAFTIAHILAHLTVTNTELRNKALAEKEMTPEQYEQMQKLQVAFS